MFFVTLFACKSNQIQFPAKTSLTKNKQNNRMKIFEKIEVIPNQIIKIEKDEAGMKYIKILNGDQTVFKYIYKEKPVDTNLMDAGYAQYVYFETGKNIKNMSLSGKDLQQIHLTVVTYGFRNSRLIPIEKGNFELKITGKNTLQYHIKIDDSYRNIRQKNIIQIIKTDENE
jgi:hypothetical protein